MSKSLKLSYSNFQDDIQTVSLLGEEIGTIERVNIRYDDNAKTPFMYVFRHTSNKYITQVNLEKTNFIVVPFSSMATKRSRLADWIWANIEEIDCNVINRGNHYLHLFSFLKEKVEVFEADYDEHYKHSYNEDHVWDASVFFEQIGKIYYFGSEHELNDRNRLFKSTSRSTLHKMKKMVEGLVFDKLEKRAEERYAYCCLHQYITPSEATKQRHATN